MVTIYDSSSGEKKNELRKYKSIISGISISKNQKYLATSH